MIRALNVVTDAQEKLIEIERTTKSEYFGCCLVVGKKVLLEVLCSYK